MDHTAQQLRALRRFRPLGGDALQQLMQPGAVGKGVVRRLPVRMLVRGAEPRDPQRRCIGEGTTEIGCRGTGAGRVYQRRDDRCRIIGEQLLRQSGMESPVPTFAAAR